MAADEDAKKDPSVTIEYQGKSCDLVFSYGRSVGVDPDFGEVHMHKEAFKDFVIRESIPGVDMLEAKTQERSAGLLSAGRLVFKMGNDNGPEHLVAWDQVLVSERGIESSFADDDDENEVHRIELTDIRMLWKTRGYVTGRINIPFQGTPPSNRTATGGGLAASPDGPSLPEVQDPEKLEKEFQESVKNLNNPSEAQGTTNSPNEQREFEAIVLALSGGKAAKPPVSATVEGPPLLPGSTNNGTPWTVESVVSKKICPELPGSPILKIQNPRPAFYDKIVGPHEWDLTLAKDALQGILDEFQLVVALNFDASITLWEKDSGELQLENGTAFTTLKTSDPNCDPRLDSARKNTTYRYPPCCVVVVGPPKIKAARIRLEPCGRSRKNGEVVPLVQALREIGLTLETAARFAVLSHEQRSSLFGITEEGLREFEEWAFKWYRLPGGAERHSDKLPILEGQAVNGSVGERLPPKVYSENFTINRVLDLRHRGGEGGGIGGRIDRIRDNLDQIKEIDERSKQAGISNEEARALLDKKAELEGKVNSLKEEVIQLVKGQPQGQTPFKASDLKTVLDVTPGSPGTFSGFLAGIAGANVGRPQILADTIASAVEKAKPQHYRVAANVPFGQQTSGYKVDLERGLVQFDAIQGHVFNDCAPLEGSYLRLSPAPIAPAVANAGAGTPAAGAVNQAANAIPTTTSKPSQLGAPPPPPGARVELEFAYVVKPGPNDDISPELRYRAVYVRQAGNDGKAAVKKLQVKPQGVAEVAVFRKELQEIVKIDGSSNRPLLDKLAEKIARDRLLASATLAGGIVEFDRPVAILNTGKVLSVRWSYGLDELPVVSASMGVFERFKPAGNPLATRGLGGAGGLESIDGGHDSVYTPRSR